MTFVFLPFFLFIFFFAAISMVVMVVLCIYFNSASDKPVEEPGDVGRQAKVIEEKIEDGM